jgi:uncharacterized RDD family membrane protein YckC
VPEGYAGERLGLPASGRGSVASFGAKVASCLIDAVVAYLVGLAVSVLLGIRAHGSCPRRTAPLTVCAPVEHTAFDRNLVITATFLVMVALLLGLTGRTVGMLLLHLQLVRLDGRRIGLAAVLRTAFGALIFPAVLADRDRRGLHDRAANTVVVNER